MSNGIKMMIVAVAAFGLGYLAAGQLAPREADPVEPDLIGKLDGVSIVLTPPAADMSLLVVAAGEVAPPNLPPGTVPLEYESGSMRVDPGAGAVSVYGVRALGVVDGSRFAPCHPGDGTQPQCGVPPPPCHPDCLIESMSFVTQSF